MRQNNEETSTRGRVCVCYVRALRSVSARHSLTRARVWMIPDERQKHISAISKLTVIQIRLSNNIQMSKMTTASSLLKGHLLMHQVALIEKYSLDVYNK